MANTTITPTVGAVALAGVAINAMTFQTGYAVAPDTWSGIAKQFTWANQPFNTPVQPGRGFTFGGWRTASFTATGTFGAAGSVQIEGSNDGVNWFKLSPTALTSAGIFAALGADEQPQFIRPNVTAGDATTSITVVGWFAL